MTDFIERFEAVVSITAVELVGANPASAAARPAPGKWSACEIMGHLIDSAANNHRRFVMAPAKTDLIFEGYDQDVWVATQRYDQVDWKDLVGLWRAYNIHLAHVMRAVPEEIRARSFPRHNLHQIGYRPFPPSQDATLGWLMEDYVMHLEHHLGQIRDLLAGRPAPR